MRLVVLAFVALLFPCCAEAAALPRILASADNPVPKCVTPASLMEFVDERNARHQPPRAIDPRFNRLASLYQHIGQCVARPPEKCVAVRWDYAFFQMLIETGYLTFRRPNGIPSSIQPQDNNFAGVGAAVAGRPGERFKDAATGVLAHLQHVLMYSTTHIPAPVANRTRQVQDDVQAIMRRLNRQVTFADLAQQWTGSGAGNYVAEMRGIADKYAANFCHDRAAGERASLR